MLEPIKVSVDVNVHLSEKTEGFILDLVKSIMPDVVSKSVFQLSISYIRINWQFLALSVSYTSDGYKSQ